MINHDVFCKSEGLGLRENLRFILASEFTKMCPLLHYCRSHQNLFYCYIKPASRLHKRGTILTFRVRRIHCRCPFVHSWQPCTTFVLVFVLFFCDVTNARRNRKEQRNLDQNMFCLRPKTASDHWCRKWICESDQCATTILEMCHTIDRGAGLIQQ